MFEPKKRLHVRGGSHFISVSVWRKFVFYFLFPHPAPTKPLIYKNFMSAFFFAWQTWRMAWDVFVVSRNTRTRKMFTFKSFTIFVELYSMLLILFCFYICFIALMSFPILAWLVTSPLQGSTERKMLVFIPSA